MSSSASLAETTITGIEELNFWRNSFKKSKPLIPGRFKSRIIRSGSFFPISSKASSAEAADSTFKPDFDRYIQASSAISGVSSITRMFEFIQIPFVK